MPEQPSIVKRRSFWRWPRRIALSLLGLLGVGIVSTWIMLLRDDARGRAPILLLPNVLNTLLPHVEDSRPVARLLELDIERLLHDNRAEEVPGRIQAMLNVERSLRDDPFMISLLVRVALRVRAVRRI